MDLKLKHYLILFKFSMPRLLHLLIALSCFFALGVALFLQHIGLNGIHYPPCPLCIFQRIGFLGVGVFCLLSYFIPTFKGFWHFLAGLFAFGGLVTSLRHQWVLSHPEASCGIDPLEVFINQFQIVKLSPGFFKADGFCSVPLPPVFGFSVPLWSLVLLLICTFALLIPIKSAGKQSS